MVDYEKISYNLIQEMKVDYVPLHDIVREFSGYSDAPKEIDFMNSLEAIKYLVEKHNVKVLEGPDMKKINKPINEIINWLRGIWVSNEYETIDYGIWFDIG